MTKNEATIIIQALAQERIDQLAQHGELMFLANQGAEALEVFANDTPDPDPDTITLSWCTEDIISRAAESGISVPISEARDILQMVERHHDCTIGVNWEVLDFYIDLNK